LRQTQYFFSPKPHLSGSDRGINPTVLSAKPVDRALQHVPMRSIGIGVAVSNLDL